MPFYKLKTGPFLFCFRNLIFPAEKRGIFKNKQTTTKTETHFYKLKLVQLCCATCFDQFLTYTWTRFNLYIYIWQFSGGLKPYIYCVFSKNAKIKETRKRKMTLFVTTPVLTALVKVSVFFCIFHFCCFWNFHIFRDVF